MPRALDPRQMQANNDPTRNGAEFHLQGFILTEQEILAELLGQFGDSMTESTIYIIETITGLDLSMIRPLIEDLALDFSSPTAFLASLINAITALPDVLVTLIASIIEQLSSGLLEENLNELLFALIELLVSLPTLLMDLGNALIESGAGLLGIESPLNALNLFNLVPSSLLNVDISHIGSHITNLLTDPNFLDTAALSTIEGWVHDLTGGYGGTGSMTVTADGTSHELLGNLIPVVEGQVLPLSGRSKWSGLAGTGEPIALAVTGYQAGSATVQETVDSHSTTPTTTDWITLSGNYTVPTNVDSLRTRLVVGSTATAGDVSFSDLSATKIGPLLQRLIAGTNVGELLPDDISHLFTGIITNTVSLLQKVEQSAHDALLDVLGGDLTQIDDRLNDFLHSLSPLNGSNIASGNIADTFVPGIGNLHDNIVTAVGNLGGTGFDLTKVFEVLTGQTHAVVDHGAGISDVIARMSNLESQFAALPVSAGGSGAGTADGGLVGAIDTDLFERVNSSSINPSGGTAIWKVTYSGGAGTWATPNGHDALWDTSGLTTREFLCIRDNTAIPRSQTNYQRVTMELSSKATRDRDLLGLYDFCGANDIWLRVQDEIGGVATTLANVTGIRIRWEGDGALSITKYVSGAPTTLASLGTGGIVPPGPGAQLIGEAGVLVDGAGSFFRAKIAESIRLTATDATAPYGPTYRRWGHGGRAQGASLLVGQTKPGGVHFWNGSDQTIT